jgi:SAM-dependent methyltransferase
MGHRAVEQFGATVIEPAVARLHDQVARLGDYTALLEAAVERGVNTELDDADAENLGLDQKRAEHYFAVGASAVRVIVDALVAAGRPAPATILDYPSGSGRVTRHLQAIFPRASITAADLYEPHVEFCRTRLGVDGVVTPEAVDDFDFDHRFDLIFCGSLLTHLPRRRAVAVLRLIARSLAPGGVAVVTTHGRRSDVMQRHHFKYVDDKRYRSARWSAVTTGFGYVSYERRFRTSYFGKQRRYGVALTRPSWTVRQSLRLDGIRLAGYHEMAWDGHHDVVCLQRAPIDS